MRKDRKLISNHLPSPIAQAVKRALATGTLALAGAGGLVAHAQQAAVPAATPTSPKVLQEVVVTGTLIALSPNDVSISPITSVGAAAMSKVGAVRVEDVLQQLPQFGQGQNSGESIGASGTACLDLRGLDCRRTLVLINGRRMGPGGETGATTGGASSPDIDQIPAALIQRVDTLTGGASSVYGADAVAGVVNFVMNTHFTGVKIDGTYSFNRHDNNNAADLAMLRNFGATLPPGTVNTGQNRDISVIMGSNFAEGKGNATAYFTFTNTSPAVGAQFDDAGCTVIGGSTSTSALHCGGSASSATGAFFETGLVNGSATTLVSDTIDKKTGLMRPIHSTDLFNYGANSYFQRSMQRYTGGAFVHYDLNDNAQVYSETMWADIDTHAQYGPSADFYSPADINCATNPLLTAQELATLCSPTNVAENQAYVKGKLGVTLPANVVQLYIGRRNVEGGPRVDEYTAHSFREVLGVKGAFGNAWTYDGWGMVSNSVLQEFHNNNLGQPEILNALNVVTDPATGQPTCASELSRPPADPEPKCVPWNIWVPGGVTGAALNYLTIPNQRSTTAREYMLQVTADGDLGQYGIKLPTANEGVKVAVGIDWREDWIDFQPDFVAWHGLTSGDSPVPPEYGNFNLWEAFLEARAPIMTDAPFVKRLGVDLGYRYSSYNLGFNTNTYKIGLEWSPINAVRFRVGYNRAVRAPNIDELYIPDSIGAGGVADPCWGATPSLSAAQCALTGVTPDEYGHLSVNPAAQINTETGGYSKLQPEIADTYTFGVVFHPESIPDLSASLDYYDISIRQTIEELQASTVITQCATGATPSFCSLIHRGPNGSLWQNIQTEYVQTLEQNIGKLETRGVDLSANYGMHIGRYGGVNLGVNGTWVHDLTTRATPSITTEYDCTGFYGAVCLAPVPHWRHVFTASWQTPWLGLGINLRWRYIGPSQVDGLSYNPNLSGDGYYTAADHIPAYSYLDLSVNVPVVKGVTATLGVNNIADKAPPLVPSGNFSACPTVGCNDNTWVGTYDTLGRYIFAHVEAKF